MQGQGSSSNLKAPTTLNFKDKTVGEILNELASRAGTTAMVSPDVADKKIDYKNLITSSNQLFLELERQFGLSIAKVNGRIIATAKDSGLSASGQTLPIVVLGQEHFGAWNVRHDQRTSYSKVQAVYLDPETNVIKKVEEQSPNGSDGASAPYPIGRRFNTYRQGGPLRMRRVCARRARCTGTKQAAACLSTVLRFRLAGVARLC